MGVRRDSDARASQPHAKDPGAWRHTLDQALMVGAAFLIAAQIPPFITAALKDQPGRVTVVLFAGLACKVTLALVCLAGAWSTLSSRLRTAGHVLGWLGVAGAASVLWFPHDLTRAEAYSLPSSAIQALQLYAVATTRSFRAIAVTILATGPAYLLLNLPAGIDGSTVEQWMVPTQSTFALGALVAYLRTGSARADEATPLTRLARAAGQAEAVRNRSVAEARRVIHDDLLSALRGVEQQLPPATVRTACLTAIASLEAHAELGTKEDLVALLTRNAPLSVEVHDEGWPEEPPGRVLDALAGAAAEALRNAARHSGQHRAVVRVRAEGRTLLLEVCDRGRGITAEAGRGFGITRSIAERMAAVGGQADVSAMPAGGTQVQLRWERPRPPDVRLTPYALEDRWRGFLPVALAITVGSSYLAWRHPGQHPALALGLVGVLAVSVPASAWYFAAHPPKPWMTLPVTLFVGSTTWIGLAITDAGALLDLNGWAVGFSAAVPMMLAFDLPVRHAAVPALAQAGICIGWAAHDPTIGALEPFGAITTAPVLCGFSGLFGALLRRGTRAIRQSEAFLAAQWEEQSWLEAREHARRVHLQSLREDVVPFLRAIVDGSPADRGRAAVLAGRCRDTLLLDQPLAGEVRRAVDLARARGVSVTFRADEQSWPDGLDRTLLALLTHAPIDVVTVFAGTRPRVVVLPALNARTRRAIVSRLPEGAALEADELRATVTLSADPTTPSEPTESILMSR